MDESLIFIIGILVAVIFGASVGLYLALKAESAKEAQNAESLSLDLNS